MHYKRQLIDNLYYIGGNDRRLSRFENMFTLPEGVSYNSYLLLDEKTVLFDGIDHAVVQEHIEGVRTVLGDRPLDYFIIHHVEPDHCDSINAIMQLYPDVKIVISKRGLTFLKQFYPDAALLNIDYDTSAHIVDEGDTLDIGSRELTFITAPNVHWPEVFMTYDSKDKILFSADAFGSFKAIEGHLFSDQVDYACKWMDEARRYYINIVGRQGAAVQKVLKKAAGLDIEMILPLHGLCHRTPEMISLMLEKYNAWSSYEPEEDGVVILYRSMYGNNHKVADTLAGMLADRNVPAIAVHDVSGSDVGVMIADMFRYSNAVIFGMNYNTELYPRMDALLREAAMLNFSNRKVSYVAAMSWGGRGLAIAREILGNCKNITEVGEPVTIKSAATYEQIDELKVLADSIAETFK